MREILFKARMLDDEEWLEGVPVDVTPLTCFSSASDRKEVVMVRAGFADWGMPRELEGAKVDPSTICQYTGLADKNGVRIFEGDKMVFDAYGKHYSGFVEFVNGSFGVNCEIAQPFLDDAIRRHGAIVIGNIYDKEEKQGEN